MIIDFIIIIIIIIIIYWGGLWRPPAACCPPRLKADSSSQTSFRHCFAVPMQRLLVLFTDVV